jgi:hypothetical protein
MGGMRKMLKNFKVTNKQALFSPRREPYKPVMADRHDINKKVLLGTYEHNVSNGVAYVPDFKQPPWRRSAVRNGDKRINFYGFRVREVNKQDETGFPTHLR